MPSYVYRHLGYGLGYDYRVGGIASLGGASGLGNPNVKERRQIIPRVYGRAFVTPIVMHSATHYDSDSTYHNMSTAKLVNDTALGARQAVDAVLALCQAGASIVGVKRAGEFVGLKKNADGTWSAANATTVLQAIRRLARFGLTMPPGYNPSGPNGIASPSFPVPTGIEVITGAASPWGYRQDRSTTNPDSWTTISGGTHPPAWAHLNGSASEGMAWTGLTHLRFEELSLDKTGKIPALEFLVDGVGGGPDCNPSVAIRDVLVHLVGIPDEKVITDEGPDGAYASSYDAYGAAMASTFALNCAVTGSAQSILDELLLACNAEIIQLPGGVVKVLALGDEPVGDYVPCAVAYEIDETDILGDSLLSMETRERSECYNAIPVQYKDANKGFEDATYTARDEFDAAQYGRRTGPPVSCRWITSAAHARVVSETLTRRSLNERRRLNFRLPPHYCLLEPGDLLTVSDVSFPPITVRIVSIDEGDDYALDVEAWEYSGATSPIDLTPEVLAPAVQAVPDTLQAAAEILGPVTAVVADGKAQKDLSDAVAESVTETLIADGAVTVDKLAANVIKTPNYAFTGTEGAASEVATAGAKMQNAPGGTALLVAPGGMKIGSRYVYGGANIYSRCEFAIAAGVISQPDAGQSSGAIPTVSIVDLGASGKIPRYVAVLTYASMVDAREVWVVPYRSSADVTYVNVPFIVHDGSLSPYEIAIGFVQGTTWLNPSTAGVRVAARVFVADRY